MYLGSGGGGGGANSGWDSDGGSGGPGGGIVLIAGSQINFTGVIYANGSNGGPGWSARDTAGNGGGGSGGSLRIEGGTISLNNVNASGASSYTQAGQGIIAVYYQNSLSGMSSNPSAYTAMIGPAPTATASPTSISSGTNPYGTGNDGNLTVSSGTTFNLSTQFSGPRSCADGISYSVIALTDTTAQLSASPASNCLKAGDEVLLINMQGVPASTVNTGNYEFLRIGGIIGDTLYFTTSKSKFYGTNSGDDSNIGTSSSQQRVMLIRVPNYNNVTISGILTGNGWNGTTNGLLVFRVAGTLSGAGNIIMNGNGYGGGAGGPSKGYAGHMAESYDGPGTGYPPSANLGGGGGANSGQYYRGGGGGYATAGASAQGSGGGTYGELTLSKLYLGSGGGGGSANGQSESGGGAGGSGGGIVLIAGSQINFTGSIYATGRPRGRCIRW